MKIRQPIPRTFAILLLLAAVTPLAGARPQPLQAGPSSHPAAPGEPPFYFEANRGQTASPVRFLSHGKGYTLFLTGGEAVLQLKDEGVRKAKTEVRRAKSDGASVLRMAPAGGNPDARITGLEPLRGRVNYLLGNDPGQWHTHIPTYGKVRCESVYPGVDLVYYGHRGQLEYDFVVAPGADPRQVRLQFQGADRLELDRQGDLVLHVGDRQVRQSKPVIYQEINGVRRGVAGGYILKAEGEGRKAEARTPNSTTSRTARTLRSSSSAGIRPSAFRRSTPTHPHTHTPIQVAFRLGPYDRTRPLIIDPSLWYSTYLGGSNYDLGNGIAVEPDGSTYVTGATGSVDFPVTAGVSDTTQGGGGGDAFVAKYGPTTDNTQVPEFLYATYIGGSGFDEGNGIAVLPQDGAVPGATPVIVGSTGSFDFPIAGQFYDGTFNGGVGEFPSDVFVARLNQDGSSLIYSTYLGGSLQDLGLGITAGGQGTVCITGQTDSANFPVLFPLQSDQPGSDAFMAVVFPVAAAGPVGSLGFTTYLEGSGSDAGTAIAFRDAAVYVAGITNSTNFPTAPALPFQAAYGGGVSDVFVTKYSFLPSRVIAYSTYLGGNSTDQGLGIAVDANGRANVTGFTSSTNFPRLRSIRSTNTNGEAFVTRLKADGKMVDFSTFLGGNGQETGLGAAVDSTGAVWVTGHTTSTDFPTTAIQTTNHGGKDAFAAELSFDDASAIEGQPSLFLLFSTYLGGTANDEGHGIAVDGVNNSYVTGVTSSVDNPATRLVHENYPVPRAVQPAYGGGASDAFVTKIGGVLPAPPPSGRAHLDGRSIHFGAVRLGRAKQRTLHLQNQGDTLLTGTVAVLEEPFRVVSGGGDFSLAPKATLQITVEFAPLTLSPALGNLAITTSDRRKAAINIPLFGSGLR